MPRIRGEKKLGSPHKKELLTAMIAEAKNIDLSLIELMDGIVDEQAILIGQQRDTISTLQNTIKVLQDELKTQRDINNLRY